MADVRKEETDEENLEKAGNVLCGCRDGNVTLLSCPTAFEEVISRIRPIRPIWIGRTCAQTSIVDDDHSLGRQIAIRIGAPGGDGVSGL
jgi:hypothetical protein